MIWVVVPAGLTTAVGAGIVLGPAALGFGFFGVRFTARFAVVPFITGAALVTLAVLRCARLGLLCQLCGMDG